MPKINKKKIKQAIIEIDEIITRAGLSPNERKAVIKILQDL